MVKASKSTKKKTSKSRVAPSKKKAAKKKTAAAKPAAAKSPAKKTAAANKGASKTSKIKAPASEEDQLQLFEQAMEAFRKQKFKDALALFEAAAQGPDGAIRHRASVHTRICRQRTGSDTVDLKTADDHYNYAIRLINDRRLAEAADHLNSALKLAKQPPAHVHYALAVVAALEDDATTSFSKLQEAIEIDPQQRLIARRDPDLAGLAGKPPISELLAGDGSNSPQS